MSAAMSFIWQGVYVLMWVEIILCSLFFVPFRWWQASIRKAMRTLMHSQFRTVIYVVVSILVILFAESLRQQYVASSFLSRDVRETESHATFMSWSNKLLKAQRNSYITGFSLLMLLFINQLTRLVEEILTLKANSAKQK